MVFLVRRFIPTGPTLTLRRSATEVQKPGFDSRICGSAASRTHGVAAGAVDMFAETSSSRFQTTPWNKSRKRAALGHWDVPVMFSAKVFDMSTLLLVLHLGCCYIGAGLCPNFVRSPGLPTSGHRWRWRSVANGAGDWEARWRSRIRGSWASRPNYV